MPKDPIPVSTHQIERSGPAVRHAANAPIADDVGFDAKGAGEGGNAASRLDGLVENFHGAELTTNVGMQPQENCQAAAMKSLAERLKYARTSKGELWTQAHLATAAGVSTGTIGNIEAGLRGVNKPIGTLPAIAKALGVRYEWLADGEGSMLEGTAPAPTAKIVRPQAMGEAVERRLTRFLAVLFQLPEAERDRALVAATEVLLDHLPPPPSA